MLQSTFDKVWEIYVKQWLNSEVNGTRISDLCELKEKAKENIFDNYHVIKNHCKDQYFLANRPGEVTLNRYKRASVISYTVILTDPIKVKGLKKGEVDGLLLKQRFAFYLGLITILMDFQRDAVTQKKVFKAIEKIGTGKAYEGNDSFVDSVYKDFLFAEIYHNYDILAVANMYGLLFDYALGFTEKDVITTPE